MRLLRQRCEAGMAARGLDTDERSMRRLEYELQVIGRLRYEPYFLAVAQVVADVRAMGIRVAARGSGVGSMVNHSLFVATANPLQHRLLFERFLSERRTSLPDIDLDVESARRLEVYDKIIERFGSERVAVTGMPETYRARHALCFPVKFSVLRTKRRTRRSDPLGGRHPTRPTAERVGDARAAGAPRPCRSARRLVLPRPQPYALWSSRRTVRAVVPVSVQAVRPLQRGVAGGGAGEMP